MQEESLKHKTKKGLYWSFFSQFSTYGMQFIIGIVMARLLSPSDYGITALPAVFMSLATVFIESGFNSALVRKQNLNENDMTTAFLYSIAVGILCYILLFFTSPLIARFYDTPVLVPLIRVTALSFLWAPLNTPQNVILQRSLNFKTPARIAIVKNIASGIVGISAAYLGYGLWALVAAGLTSSFLGFVQTWLAVKWAPKERWSRESFMYLWGFGNKLVATNLINTIYANIGPVILGKFGGTVDLGYYNRAKNYAAMPSSNVTGILTTVTFPVLSKLQNDNKALEINYRRMIKVSAYIVFPIMMMLAALAKPLVITMITAKWESCIILLQILCFVFMWQPIQILNLNVLQVKGRTDLSLKLELIKKPISVLIIIVGLRFGVIGFCLADFVVSMFALTINTHYTGKIINVGFFKQMRDIIPTLFISLAMFSSIMLVNTYISNLIFQIIVGIIVGGGVYFGLSFLFKFEEINDVKYLLNMKK